VRFKIVSLMAMAFSPKEQLKNALSVHLLMENYMALLKYTHQTEIFFLREILNAANNMVMAFSLTKKAKLTLKAFTRMGQSKLKY